MALFKNSFYYYRHLNNHSKILFSWLNVKHSEIGPRLLHGEINSRVEAKFREKDRISNDYKIIYRAPYELYCKICYGVTVFSTTAFPSVFTSLLYTHGLNSYPIMLSGIVMANSPTDLLIYTGGLVFAIGQVSLVIFRYPFRIYKSLSRDKYIIVYQHIIPWKVKKEELKAGELKKTEKSFMPWSDSLYEFRKRKAILLDDHFHRPVDLENMMRSNNKINS